MMKKIFSAFLFVLAASIVQAQTITDTAALRARINTWIVPNGVITATKLNTLLNSTVGYLRPGAIYDMRKSNDSIYITKNGVETFAFMSGTGGGSYTPGSGISIYGSTIKIQDSSNGTSGRLMWIPSKLAFRAGYGYDTTWDYANTGMNSTSFGERNMSSGTNSFTIGSSNFATGSQSIATGIATISSGFHSFTSGYETRASNTSAVAFGTSNTSSGHSSFTTGTNLTASGDYSSAFGWQGTVTGVGSSIFNRGNAASGSSSFSINEYNKSTGFATFSAGYFTEAVANYSATFGRGTKTKTVYGLAIGTWNDTTGTDRLFQIGIGTSNSVRGNAMAVLTSGKISLGKYGIGTFTGTPTYSLNVDGSGNIIEGTIGGGTTINFADNEEATGSTSSTITLAHTPTSGSVKLYKNGVRQLLAKFSISGATLTLTDSRLSTDSFTLDYRY